jgi:hypothetical protein
VTGLVVSTSTGDVDVGGGVAVGGVRSIVGGVVVVDSEPDPADEVGAELDPFADVFVADPVLVPVTVVAETVEDGEVDVLEKVEVVDRDEVGVVVEMLAEVGVVVEEVGDVAGVAAPPPADVPWSWSSVPELLAEEEGPDVAGVSAWAMPAPLINAAPRPTVIADVVTHVGTSPDPAERWR